MADSASGPGGPNRTAHKPPHFRPRSHRTATGGPAPPPATPSARTAACRVRRQPRAMGPSLGVSGISAPSRPRRCSTMLPSARPAGSAPAWAVLSVPTSTAPATSGSACPHRGPISALPARPAWPTVKPSSSGPMSSGLPRSIRTGPAVGPGRPSVSPPATAADPPTQPPLAQPHLPSAAPTASRGCPRVAVAAVCPPPRTSPGGSTTIAILPAPAGPQGDQPLAPHPGPSQDLSSNLPLPPPGSHRRCANPGILGNTLLPAVGLCSGASWRKSQLLLPPL